MSDTDNVATLTTDKPGQTDKPLARPFGLNMSGKKNSPVSVPKGTFKGRRLVNGDKPWLAALTVELYSEGTDEYGVARVLRDIAAKTVQMAREGNQWAIQEVSQRLDGRVAQAVEMTGVSMDNPEAMDRTRLLLGLVQLATQAGLITPAIDVTPAVQTSEPGNTSETSSDPVQT